MNIQRCRLPQYLPRILSGIRSAIHPNHKGITMLLSAELRPMRIRIITIQPELVMEGNIHGINAIGIYRVRLMMFRTMNAVFLYFILLFINAAANWSANRIIGTPVIRPKWNADAPRSCMKAVKTGDEMTGMYKTQRQPPAVISRKEFRRSVDL